MSISTLEEKYYRLLLHASSLIFPLSQLATRATQIQREMRDILNQLTPQVCSLCENKCCEGFPLEGWFSLEDYLLFRMRYGVPTPPPNRIRRNTACCFLTPQGCSLPEDMRPFTCVKINCEKLSLAIQAIGMTSNFTGLKSELGKIQRGVTSLITNATLSPSPPSKAPISNDRVTS